VEDEFGDVFNGLIFSVIVLARAVDMPLCYARRFIFTLHLTYVWCLVVEEKSKVMAKWQTVIPKKVRDAANIEVGDVLRWKYESGDIIVTAPRRVSKPSEKLYGLIPSREDAVEEIGKVRDSRLEKIQP